MGEIKKYKNEMSISNTIHHPKIIIPIAIGTCESPVCLDRQAKFTFENLHFK